MARTYEELLAAQTELAHFNPNHDPMTGRFMEKRGGSFTRDESVKIGRRRMDPNNIYNKNTSIPLLKLAKT